MYGDVHSGARIEATGNITVFGEVYGHLHAGILGDRTVSIYALGFHSSSVQIAQELLEKEHFIQERRYSVARLYTTIVGGT